MWRMLSQNRRRNRDTVNVTAGDNRDLALRLTPVTPAHAEALQALFEDPAVTEHLTFPTPYPPGEMAKYIW
jgi:hypothetical protein